MQYVNQDEIAAMLAADVARLARPAAAAPASGRT
jgi:hypothetical protein